MQFPNHKRQYTVRDESTFHLAKVKTEREREKKPLFLTFISSHLVSTISSPAQVTSTVMPITTKCYHHVQINNRFALVITNRNNNNNTDPDRGSKQIRAQLPVNDTKDINGNFNGSSLAALSSTWQPTRHHHLENHEAGYACAVLSIIPPQPRHDVGSIRYSL